MYSNLLGEGLGTLVLIVFGSGVVANAVLTKTKGYGAGWLAIATGWGFAVILGVFTAQSAGAPNADINPAVSLAKFLLDHDYNVTQLLATMMAQLIGAFLGAVLVWLAYLPHWRVTDDTGLKLAVFCTNPQIRHYPSNVLAETLGTLFLVLGIRAIFGSAGDVTIDKSLGPYLVGVLVWAIGLSLGGATGYAINPARDLGPRLAHAILPIAGKGSADWCYAWVPILGPFLGAVIGAALGDLVF